MVRSTIPVLIPAAGKSRRMRGADKLMMQVGGVPLLRHVAQMACDFSNDVRIALPLSPDGPHPRVQALSGLPVRIINLVGMGGELGDTLSQLFGTLNGGHKEAMIMLADMPQIEATDLWCLAQGAVSNPDAQIWRAATQDGAPGHPILVARALFDSFAALGGVDGGRVILDGARTQLIPLSDARARLDLDTPEDWENWRAQHS